MFNRCSKKTLNGRVCKNKRCNGLKVCNVHARECSICLCKTTEGEICTLTCGHSYHTCCIYPWFENDHRCPECRTSVRRPKVTVSINFDISDIHTIYVREMLNNLYTNGTLPDGPIHIENYNNRLVVIDLSNNTEVASTEVN